MQSILNQESFASMLSQKHSILYFYVDWSVNAVQGLHILEEAEFLFSQIKDDSPASFWLADISDVNAPAAFIGEWLKVQERSDLKMYNVVAVGSGSVAWLKRGEIIDFAMSATHHNALRLAERTRHAFGKSAT